MRKSKLPFTIAAPSYKRPKTVTTQAYLPDCLYVVAENEADAYREQGHEVIACPYKAQGNLCRVRNWMMDNLGKSLLILDDDITALVWFECEKQVDMKPERALQFIADCFDIAEQWGARFWGLNPLPDKMAYREFTPFSTVSYIGGPVQGHINNPLRYDEGLPLKEDYDMTLQVLNKYRTALRFNHASYRAKQNEMEGGCATYRTSSAEELQMLKLMAKWGKDIVRRDGGEKTKGRRTGEILQDINPIIRAPIKGI